MITCTAFEAVAKSRSSKNGRTDRTHFNLIAANRPLGSELLLTSL
jgi:hypothetical protein